MPEAWDQISANLLHRLESNGLIERFHRQLGDALRARLAREQWVEHLPWVLLGFGGASKEDTSVSSAEMVHLSQGTPEASSQQTFDRIRSEVTDFQGLPSSSNTAPAVGDSNLSSGGAPFHATYMYIPSGGFSPSLPPPPAIRGHSGIYSPSVSSWLLVPKRRWSLWTDLSHIQVQSQSL
jgi:hypothetical protein